ncbi:hypothetical protein M885DRAFT_197983 [Pelagophyceae sp. CCMP2097]|nr:hypothetical protein M885DRAFT_197983 [Pelagophyceae sp. CCMP2097]
MRLPRTHRRKRPRRPAKLGTPAAHVAPGVADTDGGVGGRRAKGGRGDHGRLRRRSAHQPNPRPTSPHPRPRRRGQPRRRPRGAREKRAAAVAGRVDGAFAEAGVRRARPGEEAVFDRHRNSQEVPRPAPAAPAPAAAPEPVRCATFGTADSSPPEPESRRATFEQFQAFESDAAMFEAFDTAAGGAPPAGGAPGAEPPRSPIRRPPALGIRAPQSAGAGAAPARAMRDGARALRVGARTRTPAADPAAARAAAFSPRGAPLPRPAKFVSREVPAALAVARPSLVDVFADKQHATQVDVDIRSEALDYLFARRQLSPRRRVRDSLVAGAESLVLDDYGLSDEYSRVVIEALQGRDLLRHVSVRNNRLTALGLAQLVTALPAGVVTLDLSGNRQGCVNVEAGGALGEAFALTKCTVEKLGLASASLRSSDCVALVSGLVARKVPARPGDGAAASPVARLEQHHFPGRGARPPRLAAAARQRSNSYHSGLIMELHRRRPRPIANRRRHAAGYNAVEAGHDGAGTGVAGAAGVAFEAGSAAGHVSREAGAVVAQVSDIQRRRPGGGAEERRFRGGAAGGGAAPKHDFDAPQRGVKQPRQSARRYARGGALRERKSRRSTL